MQKFYCLDPHPDAIKAWKESGYVPTPLDVKSREQIFLQSVGKGQSEVHKFGQREEYRESFVVSTEEEIHRPITRQITKMYRTDNGNVLYNEYLEGTRWDNGDPINHTRIVGRVDMPSFRITKNRETNTVADVTIRDKKPRFDITLTEDEFTDPSTEKKTTLAELYKLKSSDFVFYLVTGARKFALRGITLDQFLHKAIADLQYYGENKGSWPEATATVIPAQTTDNSQPPRPIPLARQKKKVEANE